MIERIRWTEEEFKNVAREFVALRLKNITGTVTGQLAQAEAQALPIARRRNYPSLAAYGQKLSDAIEQEMTRVRALVEHAEKNHLNGAAPEPAAAPIVEAPPLEPIFIEVQVPRIVEVEKPVDFHKIMEATPPGMMLGYVLTKLLPMLSATPLMAALPPEAMKLKIPDPAQIVKAATAPAPPPPPKGPQKVLCIGFSADFVKEVEPKALRFTNLEIDFINLRGYGQQTLSCDYCVLSSSIGTRSPVANLMAGKLGPQRVRYARELETEIMQVLANFNSLQTPMNAAR